LSRLYKILGEATANDQVRNSILIDSTNKIFTRSINQAMHEKSSKSRNYDIMTNINRSRNTEKETKLGSTNRTLLQ